MPRLQTDAGTALILVRPVRYSFAQLQRWYNFHLDVSGIEGITFTDIDEARNRLVVGVEDAASRERVQQRIARLDLPSGVVVVEESGPICSLISRAAVSVWARDARTKVIPQREVTLIVREGAYVDSLTRRFVGGEGPGWLGAAWDRAGTYRVVVHAPGYREWVCEGVHVPEGKCGAESVVLEVALEPATRPYR